MEPIPLCLVYCLEKKAQLQGASDLHVTRVSVASRNTEIQIRGGIKLNLLRKIFYVGQIV